MSGGNKWAAIGVAASVVGVAALGGVAMAYFMAKEEEEFRQRTMGAPHVSSRPVTTELQIPHDQAGIVIGRGGQTIREIQSRTNTRIHFKDELETEEFRSLSIVGLPDDVKLAEIMIYQTFANQPNQETFEMRVPAIFIGAIIGRNGENVRSMQDRSRCRIDVERSTSTNFDVGDRKVTLRGSHQQIQLAKTFIQEIINEERIYKGIKETKTLFLTSESHDNTDDQTTSLDDKPLETEELIATSEDTMIDIYVSSISHPGSFHVQKVGPTSIALDKLVQDMTNYYEQHHQFASVESNLEIGTLVAAKQATDGNWYRAKVSNINKDDYDDSIIDVQVEIVDFGHEETKTLDELCVIKDQFLKLKCQAIKACMADIKPVKGSDWSSEAIDDFESLTHTAQWKSLLAQVIKHDNDECLPCLKLVDANEDEDINIGDELVARGHAQASEN